MILGVWMRRALATGAAVLAFAFSGQIASAQTQIFIDSTDDPPGSTAEKCEDGAACTLRRAINSAQQEQNGAIVRACFDPAEIPNALPCPTGATPLRTSDPNYDAASGRWIIKLKNPDPIQMIQTKTWVDLRQGLRWNSPADNRIVLDANAVEADHVFAMESDINILAGFEIRGAFERAAILIRGGLTDDTSKLNQVGPGMIFANMPRGSGVHVSSDRTHSNRIIGNWCGITGDGTELSPLTDDCVYLEQGTFGNVIGDASPTGKNVFAATTKGSGVRIEDSEFAGLDIKTRNNAIEYNWFGLDAQGEATEGLDVGVLVVWASENKIRHNVISSARNMGVSLNEEVTGTLITDNVIGGSPDGSACRGNRGDGISLLSGPKQSRIERNTIICNQGNGITIQGANTYDNRVSQNAIGLIEGRVISLLSGANHKIAAPTVDDIGESFVAGTTCAGCTVEIFSDGNRQARFYEGSTVADEAGSFRLEKAEGFSGRFVVATTTNANNTSETSAARVVPGGNSRSTATPTGVASWTPPPGNETPTPPGPSPTQSMELPYRIHLPVILRGFDGLGEPSGWWLGRSARAF